MITFFFIIGFLISLGFNVIAFILARNLLKKINVYEQWIIDFKEEVNETFSLMKEIDKQGIFATSLNDKGVFEADDQVGQTFKDLYNLIEKLNGITQ